jgi:hypothetical protein
MCIGYLDVPEQLVVLVTVSGRHRVEWIGALSWRDLRREGKYQY